MKGTDKASIKSCRVVVHLLKVFRLKVNLFFFSILREYLDRMAEEINETLQESGQVFVSEFSKTFTLPTDFVLEVGRVYNVIHLFGANP